MCLRLQLSSKVLHVHVHGVLNMVFEGTKCMCTTLMLHTGCAPPLMLHTGCAPPPHVVYRPADWLGVV